MLGRQPTRTHGPTQTQTPTESSSRRKRADAKRRWLLQLTSQTDEKTAANQHSATTARDAGMAEEQGATTPKRRWRRRHMRMRGPLRFGLRACCTHRLPSTSLSWALKTSMNMSYTSFCVPARSILSYAGPSAAITSSTSAGGAAISDSSSAKAKPRKKQFPSFRARRMCEYRCASVWTCPPAAAAAAATAAAAAGPHHQVDPWSAQQQQDPAATAAVAAAGGQVQTLAQRYCSSGARWRRCAAPWQR